MEGFLLDAGTFLLRWLHVVAAIAWIGESFYFVALDRGLAKPSQPAQGLAGESWSVHGGGFYLKQKFLPAPAQLPEVLHWSKWKSYTTWLSGFALLCVTYLWSPQIHLVDPSVARLEPGEAVAAVLTLLLVGWLAYDLLCRVVGTNERLLGALVALLVLGLCLLTASLFSGRAAFLVTGAVIATWMSANVFFVIIPGQRRMVDALQRGEAPNPLDGSRGKQRSVHNTYFTLPVVFAMLSTHYATAWASPHNGWVLALFLLGAAMIRQFFVVWHSGGRLWWLLASGALVLAACFAVLAPRPGGETLGAVAGDASMGGSATPGSATSSDVAVAQAVANTASVLTVLQQRCHGCHASQPQLMPAAPKGAIFERAEEVERQAELIHRQVVIQRIMPPGNLTQMTEDERAVIDRWYAGRGGTR